MNNFAEPIDPLDAVDALLDAGADLAQALQDIIDDQTNASRSDLQELVDAWEQAYRMSQSPSDEEPE